MAIAAPLLAAEPTSGVRRTVPAGTCPPLVRYYHHDAADNLWAMTDDAGAVVWRAEVHPFGQGIALPPDRELRFLDQPRDGAIGVLGGLYQVGVRYLDPVTGRFLSADPLSLTAVRLDQPQRFNRFAYGLNNPERFSDRSGKAPQDRQSGAGGASPPPEPRIPKTMPGPLPPLSDGIAPESRKVTKIPLVIINERGETPLDLLLNPQKLREALLKKQSEQETPLPEQARRAVEELRAKLQTPPGGGVRLSEELVREVERLKREKEARNGAIQAVPGVMLEPPSQSKDER